MPAFIGRLSGLARSALPIVRRGVREGLSSRQIDSSLRAAGINLSRSRTILPMMNAIREEVRLGESVRFVAKGRTINVGRLPEALTPIRRRFSYDVRIRARDAFGQLIERHVTVTTDSASLRPQDVEEAASELVSDVEQYGDLQDIEANVVFGRRNPEFPE